MGIAVAEKYMLSRKLALSGVALYSLTFIPLELASADSVADFYTSRPLAIYVGSDPGGGYDAYARIFAKYFSAHLPGRPKTAIEFIPAAAGIAALNFIANEAPRDGSVIGAVRAANIIEPLLQQGTKVAHYDPGRLSWIGNISRQQGTCFTWHTSPIKTIEQAKAREVSVASTGPLSNIGTFPNILNRLIGTKFKVITAPNLRVALEGGTAEGICGMSYSTIKASAPEWISGNKLNFLAQSGLEKTPALRDVPLVKDLAKTDADRALFQLLDYREIMGRPYVAPEGVSHDRLAALRRAFEDTMRDADFRSEAESHNLDVDPTPSQGIEAMIADAYSMPPEVVKRTWDLMHSGK
jgi:tripartite-type tricarboxylate transporter receptor subunit TctC